MIVRFFSKLFTVLGVLAGVVIFGFYVLGKWIEYDCERANKTMY